MIFSAGVPRKAFVVIVIQGLAGCAAMRLARSIIHMDSRDWDTVAWGDVVKSWEAERL